MPREINLAGYDLIKEFEAGPKGNRQPALTPYLCPAGKWTNGWGNTHGVTADTPAITVARAEMDLNRNLDWAEACVEKYAPGANDNEFAAMVSLCFNVGPDPKAGFPSSSVCRLLNKGDKAGAAAAFALWRKMRDPSSGQLVDSPGLLRRRNVEAALFLKPVVYPSEAPPASVPMPQAVAPEKSAVTSKTVAAGVVTVAAGAGSVVDQLDTLRPVLDTIATTGASMQSVLKLGAAGLSIIALAAGVYMLWRYIQKKRRGEVMST